MPTGKSLGGAHNIFWDVLLLPNCVQQTAFPVAIRLIVKVNVLVKYVFYVASFFKMSTFRNTGENLRERFLWTSSDLARLGYSIILSTQNDFFQLLGPNLEK